MTVKKWGFISVKIDYQSAIGDFESSSSPSHLQSSVSTDVFEGYSAQEIAYWLNSVVFQSLSKWERAKQTNFCHVSTFHQLLWIPRTETKHDITLFFKFSLQWHKNIIVKRLSLGWSTPDIIAEKKFNTFTLMTADSLLQTL